MFGNIDMKLEEKFFLQVWHWSLEIWSFYLSSNIIFSGFVSDMSKSSVDCSFIICMVYHKDQSWKDVMDKHGRNSQRYTVLNGN